MPQIKPFKGILYNKRKVGSLASVVAPPYDVIPKDMQETFYRSSPYNIVRLILGKINPDDDSNNNRYTRAGKLFSAWLKKDVMVKDKKESIYVCSQTYKTGTKVKEQIGFIALMALEEKKNSKILPHENTLLAPKLDRLNLIRAVKANLSPIFVLYEDPKHNIMKILKHASAVRNAIIDVNFGNVRHRVWRMDDSSAIKSVEKMMRGKDIFIADGHHRYEVSRMYRAEIQDQDLPEPLKDSSRYLMVYFVESDEKMLTILPAHRVVKDIGSLKKDSAIDRLERSFYIKRLPSLKTLMLALADRSDAHAFGMYIGKGAFYILNLKNPEESDRAIKSKPKDWKRLDVSILHIFILQRILGIRDEDDNIEFFKDPQDAVKLVDRGEGQIAFFLNPTKVSQVKRVARLGERMPRKATYFYPKPLSGLAINKH